MSGHKDDVKCEEVIDYPSSVLGTKEYWDNAYKKELENFADHGDEGEVWFGEDAMDRVFRWLDRHQDQVPKDTSRILDLGCGNGVACIELACEEYGHVTGIDYSSDAIQLATQIAKSRQVDNVKFKQCDVLMDAEEVKRAIGGDDGGSIAFDVCLDKGTFDAIALCPDDAITKRAKYVTNVAQLLTDDVNENDVSVKKTGLLIITSCNFTENELVKHFESEFQLVEFIPTPSFCFGGATGNMVTSAIFKKRRKHA